MDIGKRLRELRESRGFTSQESFAALLGVSRQRIQQIEKATKLRRSTLMFFLSKLGVTEHEFYGPLARKARVGGGDEPAYGIQRKQEKRKTFGRRDYDLVWQGTTPTQRERVKRALDVLMSNDKVTRTALEKNIEAFHRAVTLLGGLKE